jgi:hypothetical protein
LRSVTRHLLISVSLRLYRRSRRTDGVQPATNHGSIFLDRLTSIEVDGENWIAIASFKQGWISDGSFASPGNLRLCSAKNP